MPVRLIPVGEVIIHEEAGDAFLLQVSTGRYYGLNRSGLVIWNALVSGLDPLGELVKTWPNRPEPLLRRDADALIAELVELNLLAREA